MAYFANLLSLFVLTTTLMFFFISPSHSISPSPPVKPPFPPVKPQKVDLAVYYKTLSPRCADFIVNYLKLVFQTDLNTIVNLRLVPWVNAKVINGSIYCWQGGVLECYLNIIEACVIKAYPEVKTHFPLISCIEAENSALMQEKHSEYVEKSWRKCAHNLGFPQEPIDKCFNTGEVIKPSHLPLGYLPRVIVNNVPLKKDYLNYIDYVCKEYEGTEPIKACKSSLSSSTLKKTSVQNSLSFFAAENSETQGTNLKPSPPRPAT